MQLVTVVQTATALQRMCILESREHNEHNPASATISRLPTLATEPDYLSFLHCRAGERASSLPCLPCQSGFHCFLWYWMRYQCWCQSLDSLQTYTCPKNVHGRLSRNCILCANLTTTTCSLSSSHAGNFSLSSSHAGKLKGKDKGGKGKDNCTSWSLKSRWPSHDDHSN
jgi:hypothetical protein